MTGGAGDDVVQIISFGYNASPPYADVVLAGRGGDDRLSVDAGNATLSGGGGDDTLSGSNYGGAAMTGGKGNDLFLIEYLGGATDRITDFSGLRTDVAGDQIQFDYFGMALPVTYIGAHGFYGTGALEIRYSQKQGALVMDLGGDGDADGTIVLTGMTAATDLTQADFL